LKRERESFNTKLPLWCKKQITFLHDFHLLNVWDSKGVFFVIRHKENLQYDSKVQLDLPQNRRQNIMIDELIELKNPASQKKYGKKLRRVAIWDDKNKQTI
jgi:IS4 transposase